MLQQLSVYPVPIDISSTFNTGSSMAPSTIRSVMHQLDNNHPFLSNANTDIHFLNPHHTIESFQLQFFEPAQSIISKCNTEIPLTKKEKSLLDKINHYHQKVHQQIQKDSQNQLKKSSVLLLGGEHGVGLGYVQALGTIHESFGILHIDAHMDCRSNYFGFNYSHASVFTHYSQLHCVKSITQVGIRDYDVSEIKFQHQSATPFHVFYDYSIHRDLFKGTSWNSICTQIVESLPKKVMISLDVDGLDYCASPNTGTPVPGGIGPMTVVVLMKQTIESAERLNKL